jgi:dipeptidyl aminopeptidase/acylaminoacyl peptidase
MGATRLLLCLTLAGLVQSANIIPVTKENLYVGDFALSADGTRLAYTVSGQPRSGREDLWIRDVATLRGEKLATPDSFGNQLAFAPDGKSLYYIAPDKTKAWENNLHQWPLSGGEDKIVASHVDSQISFSPDGQHIAFFRNLGHGRTSLMVRELGAGTEHEIRQFKMFAWVMSAAWSPDSKEIFCSTGTEMLLISVASGAERKVAAPVAQGSKNNESQEVAPGVFRPFHVAVVWPARAGLMAIYNQQVWRYDPARNDPARNDPARNDAARSSWTAVTERENFGWRLEAAPDGATLAAVRFDEVAPVAAWFGRLFGFAALSQARYSNVILIHLAR